jgi:ABC-2 type transport system permease protein
VRGVNWLGLLSLARKEIRRFLVVWVQTLVGPIVFALLLLLIFGIVLGQGRADALGVDYLRFLAPGLIVMTMLQNAFSNTSSSILIAKQSGTIADVVMAPLHPAELVLGYAAGGVARGLLLGALLAVAMLPFAGVPRSATSAAIVAAFGLGGALLFALLGIIGGLMARKMEHIAFMSQIVVAPLTLLSGTFYSIGMLPEAMREGIRFNPVFYLIDGFRSGYVSFAESNVAVGLIGLGCALAVLLAACVRMFATGYGVKA